jgi:DNA invertase Pin-like site-specific DNA recombinase
MQKIGYARVSTTDQDCAMQIDALTVFGVQKIYRESGSGVGPRLQLREALAAMQPGDVLTVWKIDRVARSLGDLLAILAQLKAAGAAIRSLTEPIDTTTPLGEFTFQILGAVAQLERSMIRERVMAGQAAARARGKTWGPKRYFSRTEAENLATMWRSGIEQATLAEMFGTSLSTLRDTIHWAEHRGRWKSISH